MEWERGDEFWEEEGGDGEVGEPEFIKIGDGLGPGVDMAGVEVDEGEDEGLV